jgi:hypothetical protein
VPSEVPRLSVRDVIIGRLTESERVLFDIFLKGHAYPLIGDGTMRHVQMPDFILIGEGSHVAQHIVRFRPIQLDRCPEIKGNNTVLIVLAELIQGIFDHLSSMDSPGGSDLGGFDSR